MLRLDAQNIQITPEDRLTVLCEITIDGKDTQQSGQNQVRPVFHFTALLTNNLLDEAKVHQEGLRREALVRFQLPPGVWNIQ